MDRQAQHLEGGNQFHSIKYGGCAMQCQAKAQSRFLVATTQESWDDGYQAAVDALREMADHLTDPDAVEVVMMLATALESTKP